MSAVVFLSSERPVQPTTSSDMALIVKTRGLYIDDNSYVAAELPTMVMQAGAKLGRRQKINSMVI